MHEFNFETKKLTCKFDGMCQPVNPRGISCYGFIIHEENEQSSKIYEEGGIALEPFSEKSSNNVAEYIGLIKLLEWLLHNNYNKSTILIQGDSQLIINQISGKYRVRSKKIMSFYEKTRTLLQQFEDLQIEWISREKNHDADGLANKAYINFIDSHRKEISYKLKPHFASAEQISLLRQLKINVPKYLSRIEANRYLLKYNKKNN